MNLIPNLLSFAFVDPSMFFSTMTLKYGRHFADFVPANGPPPFSECEHIILRGPADANWNEDGEQVDYRLLTEWPSARKLIEDIGNQITTHLAAENLQLGQVIVRSLCAGGVVGWHADDSAYAKAYQRFALLVSPCAGSSWFSAGETLAPGVGNLTYFNNRVLHSAINLGPVPQISVILDVRRPALQ
jgi:hypothetical protein